MVEEYFDLVVLFLRNIFDNSIFKKKALRKT